MRGFTMNEKELREIKRRFRPDRSNIPNIVGCFINASGQIISRFNQSILLTESDESEALLTVMKKTLSGSLGTNLVDMEFSTRDVTNAEEHKLLMTLRDSHLKDEEALGTFFSKIAESVHMNCNYVVLLANDIYDVYTKENDEESGSSTTFSYIVVEKRQSAPANMRFLQLYTNCASAVKAAGLTRYDASNPQA